MKRTYRIPILLAAIVIIAVLIQGCGGGSSKSSAVHGTVADLDRNVVIDADVWIGAHHARTLVTGAFRIENVPSGWQTIHARATVDGRQWEGSTAVEVLRDEPTMNANIVLAPAVDLTTITGTVTAGGRRISGARVLVTTRILLPSGSSSQDGAYGSIVAVTDSRGDYRLEDVPMGRSAVIGASNAGFDNDEVQVDEITDGMSIDFNLIASTQQIPDAPELTGVESWTMPNPLVRSFSTQATQGNPYDAVRAFTSKKFRASLQNRKTSAAAAPMAVRAVSAGSLIEIDLYWNALDVNLSRDIAGYGIYRSVGSADFLVIDWVRDPYANFYGDMGGEIEPGVNYDYSVSAVNLDFLDKPVDQTESNWSNVLGVTPLGSLQAQNPSNDASVGGNPVFTWQPVSRADSYSVYVYAEFPTIPLDPGGDYGGSPPSYGVFPIWTSDWEDVDSVQYAGPALSLGHRYYWIVTGQDTSQSAYSYSELRSFTR